MAKLTLQQTKGNRSSEGPIFYKKAYRWKGISKSFAQNEENQLFYVLKTNSRFSTFLEYKRMEHFFFGLSPYESVRLLSNELFLDDLTFQIFSARNSLQGFSSNCPLRSDLQQQLLERVTTLQGALGLHRWSLNLLYTYKGVVKYEWDEDSRRIHMVKNNGKRIRTPSAVGSKRFGTSSLKLEELQNEQDFSSFNVKRNFIPFLVSPIEDYNLLFDLFDQKSIIYSTLIKLLKAGTPFPPELKPFLLYQHG